ncbi:MAG: FCD domain-containing protein [Gammaproteobacteria bacterium]
MMNLDAAQTLALLKGNSLPSVVQSELERRILAGVYGMGGRINEQALASALGVSRGPIREACRALVSCGLLEFINNRGFFTRRIGDSEAQDIYDLREDLEAAAAGRFAEKCSKTAIAEFSRLITEMDAAVQKEDFDSYYPLNLAFHQTWVAGIGNVRLLQVHRECVRDLHLLRAHGLVQKGGMTCSNREHKAIYCAFKAHDPAAAAAAVSAHIKNGKERMFAAIVRDRETQAA